MPADATRGSGAAAPRRIAVVGAGLAGLTAARALAAEGHDVVVFEKSRGVGGRLATRRIEGLVLDHGCPALDVPAHGRLDATVAALAEGEVERYPGGESGHVTVVLASGQTCLAKHLAEGVEIRRSVRVSALRPIAAGLEVADEQGNSHGAVAAAVVAAPAPQAAELLAASGETERAARMAAVAYEPAICVLTDAPGAPPEPGPVVEGPPPLAALSLEWRKRESPGGARPVVARLDPAASRMLLERSDEEVLALAMPAIAGVLGPPGAPWTQVKRWRYALPAGRADPSLVAVPESRIVLAGDAFTGTDLEAVMATGDRAAALVADLVG